MDRWFVTGVDTGVGKTTVTAALAAAARPLGPVLAAKLVATGVDEGPGDDAIAIARAGGHDPKVFATFRAPLSPHRAALLEGRPLDVPALWRWLDDLRGETVLVEGAGGLAVPLSLEPLTDTRDAARRFGGQVLVVAPDRIGVLSQTVLCVEAISALGLTCVGVVLNRGVGDDSDPARAHNHEDLGLLLSVPVLVFPPINPTDLEALRREGARLWRGLVLPAC